MFRTERSHKLFPPLSLLVLATIPNWPVLASMSVSPTDSSAIAADVGTPYYDSVTAAIVAAVSILIIRFPLVRIESISARSCERDGRYTWVAAAGIPGTAIA